MDRRCAAGALLALAACIATTAAAPTANNQTALDLYEGPSEGCYYNFQHYGEGDRIMTNEPCLNCTCHNRMLMCYLRVCPFTKPIGQDCSVEKRADQCCPIVTCPDVPVDLLTSTSTSSPSEYGETGLGKLDRYGCSINGKYFPEGSKVPPSPNKPCEHCYCIRNMTTCVMQECTLHVDGCTPIYRKDVCCPVRYSCDHPEDEIPLLDDMTTTVRPTPGFLLTTTTLAPVTQMSQDCVHDDKIFADGALIKTEKACEHCYCMKGDIVCVVQECGTPMENEGKNCTSMPPREGQCCPDTYICEGDEVTAEPKPDTATVTPYEDITTLSPPRRVSVEGSGYRSETDEPSTEISRLEPDIEGSGEDQPLKPTDATDIFIPESETTHTLIVTDQDEIADHYSPSTTEVLESEPKVTEKTTTEADKGENTVPNEDFEEDSSDKPLPEIDTTTTKLDTEKESSDDALTTVSEPETFTKDKTTPSEEIAVTKPSIVAESTIDDHELHAVTSHHVGIETTIPTRRKEDDEILLKETTTVKHLEEATTPSSDIAPDTVATATTTSSFIEQEIETTISQLTEKDKVKESTTESHIDLTTEFDVIKTETQSATTVQPVIATELTTPSKGEISDTTSANPIENEIDEESFPTLAPGRVPGEGDCLLDGVTYSHESVVPSSSNCHTSCKCISSIVKCEPIVCSPPPDYMDNCQPMYDSPESCCPTYVCDHPRETVPPQSHSQMAGTESPLPTPAIECDGDQCQIVKEKEDVTPSTACTSEGCTDEPNKKHDECGPQGCGEVVSIPAEASQSTEDCIGDSCSSPPESCVSGKCEAAVPKDQTCENENGCDIPVVPTCQGHDCAIQPDVPASKVDSTPCDSPNGCEIPAVQTCEGDNCANQPDITASKDDSIRCDNPDGCKDAQIPETAPHCKGDSCISELPPKPAQESQECKNGNDCGQTIQTPTIEECNEKECKSQHIPEINKPAPSDCAGTECTQQQDNLPRVTESPQPVSTESIPSVTELPEEPETKSEEPVTELPKTTGIEKEIEPSAITKESDKGEEPGTTPQYGETDHEKDKDTPSIIPEKPEIATGTTEVPQDYSITESAKIETTMALLQDVTKVKETSSEVTPALSEVTTTGIPSLSENYTKELTTSLPNFTGTELQESTINPINDDHSELPEDDTKDKDTFDIPTTEGAILSSSPKVTQETTESPEILTLAPETLDRDGHEKTTKEPEYVQDTEEKITEPTERYTYVPEQITDKVEVEPIQEQEAESTSTTTKSYDSQTSAPETETILPQDEDDKLPELPVSPSIPEESNTGKPDDTKQIADGMATPDGAVEAETNAPELVAEKTTSKPEAPHDVESQTQPESDVTPDTESITQAPISDITGESETPKPLVTLPHDITVEESDVDKNAETPSPITVNIQTQTPMSIVKDHSDDEVGSTVTPEPVITTEHISSQPESPEATSSPSKTQTEEQVSDTEKMPSVSDEGYTAAITEPSVAIDVLPTKQSVEDSETMNIPETETSTDSLPVSVYEPTSSEPSVTEVSVEESSAPLEETSVETKSPTSVTESPVQPITAEAEIVTPAQKQSDANEDFTELPELIVHEHPTEPSSIEQESEQPAKEDTITIEPQEAVTTVAPILQDAVTVSLETPDSVSQKEATLTPDQESATKTPEFTQPQTVEPKPHDMVSEIPESFTTESQKEVTEGSRLQTTTSTPEETETGTQKQEIDTPDIQATTTSTPKASETTPQVIITESQPTVTETDVIATQHQDTTDAPVSIDIVTDSTESSHTTSDIHKESPAISEEPNIQSHTEITKTQDITTTVPELSLTESHKESTESPESEDSATKVADISPDTSDKETSEEPKPQEAVTIAPDLSATKPEPTTASEVTDTVANEPDMPETVQKEQTTESPVEKDVVTSVPELLITETVPVEDTNVPVVEEKLTTIPEISVTEYEKESTEAPTRQDPSSGIPETYATEPQENATEAPAAEDKVSRVPETLITESHKDTQHPESEEPITNLPESPTTEPKKETTDGSELQETSSTIPETSETKPTNEITEIPEIQGITNTPEISPDTQPPETAVTVSLKDDTTGAQNVATNAPEISTKSENDVTEIQVSTEKSLIEPINVPTEQTTESQEPETDLQEITHAVATSPPEMLATKSDKETTETSIQELTTKAQEPGEHEQELEKSTVTENEILVTEPPVKITTKFDHSAPQESVTATEPSKIESETSHTTESGSPMIQDTKVPESLATEYPLKTTDSDAETEKPASSMTTPEEKPYEGQEIETEPAQTELPIVGPIEPDTKAPETTDTEAGTTVPPELTSTEEQDSKVTQSISTPIEEHVTKTPETVETQDKTTKISEEPEQTTKEEYPETTPESVLLEEHTHKTISPDDEISSSPSDVPSKEYETSTPEVSIDKVTVSTPSTESEKSPQEDILSNKDHYTPEVTQTTTPEISTRPEEITTISPLSVPLDTEQPQNVESNEISTSAPMIDEEPTETEKPLVPNVDSETEKELVSSEKPQETIAPEDEFILATTKATTVKAEEPTTLSPLLDKFGKPDDGQQKPVAEPEQTKPDVTEEVSKPGANEVQPTEEAPEEEGHFPPSGTSGYGQEPDYGEEDSFGPGTCRYGGKVYVSAQQIPRDDPCDFCFCFRSDIICLQQSCPPPIHGCHEEPIQGFCCPRYECPVSMATTLNVTTTTTTTTTTLPPHFLPHAYKGAAQRRGCQIKGHTYKVGEVVRASSGPCLHCTCGGDGQMKCDPKVCTPEPMLRQMIAAAVSAKRRR